MDFIKTDIKKLYKKLLIASIASALATAIYTFVDSIAVGQAVGPMGSAAMSVISPFYGIMIFLAILCGVGGAVLMSSSKSTGNEEKGNAYFTASVILMGTLIVLVWIVFCVFHQQILSFFGANEELMPTIMEYTRWIIYAFPIFLMPVFLGAFIRNDGAPNLAMAAVLIGGSINIFGDWFFVFYLELGMSGAAIATVVGTSIQVIIMVSHFFSKRCHLRLVKPYNLFHALRNILAIGFGASILEIGTIVLVIVTNNQIMRYSDTSALAVYGVIGTISALFQAVFGGVGQAIQPIVSANYGTHKMERVKSVWKMSLRTVMVMGVVFAAIGVFLPEQIVRLFMDVTPEVIAIAPSIIRPYFMLFIFLGITVLSTYYLQSTMQGKQSTVVAILRSVVVSGLLLLVLPVFMGSLGIWIALPLSEVIVTVIALYFIRETSKKMVE